MNDTSFKRAFYHLGMAKEYFEDEMRERPTKVSGDVAKKYRNKIDWIINDFITDVRLPKEGQMQFKRELNGDLMFFESISQKSLQLSEEQRRVIETVIDCVLKGEKITVEIDNHNNPL